MPFITQSLLLKALGWSLLNSLWQMALLWLVYLLITGMGKRFSATAKHSLALLLSTAGLGWFLYTFFAGIVNKDFLSVDFAAILLTAGSHLSGAVLTIKKAIASILPYLSFLYLGALLLISLRYVQYYLRLQQIKLTGLQKIQPALRLFVHNVSQQLGIHRKVAVWLSAIVDSPMTIGFLKPIILIPIATVNHLTTEQVETILLHELTHIKRNDYLVNIFVTVFGMIFFFNPFAKLFINSIKKEREHSCDDLVMQFQYHPHTYASALLSLERTRHRHHQLAMNAIGKSNQLLLERVKRVTGHKHVGQRYSFGLMGCLLIAFAAAFTVALQPAKPAVENKKWISKVDYPATEMQQLSYVLTAPAEVKEQTKKTPKSILKFKIRQKKTDGPENGLIIADENELENVNDENNNNMVTTVNQYEDPREFTIAAPSTATVPPQATTNVYPYVPSSSFSFQVTEDTLKFIDKKLSYVQIATDESMQKTLWALNEINWQKIEKDMTDNKQVNIEKIQNDICISLKKAAEKQNITDIALVCSKADEKRIRETIKLQLQLLHNFKIKYQSNAQDIRVRLSNEDVQQRQIIDLKKQMETIRKAQETLKKKIVRIIYI